jgi:hypothetical protein
MNADDPDPAEAGGSLFTPVECDVALLFAKFSAPPA